MSNLLTKTETRAYLGVNMEGRSSFVKPNASLLGMRIYEDLEGYVRRLRQRQRDFDPAELDIPFQYIAEVPAWTKSANWNSLENIMGRFESVNMYSNSASQDFSVTAIYYAEGAEKYGHSTYWTMERVERISRAIKSLVFPQYDLEFGPPKKVLLNIGNVWQQVPVIVKNVSEKTEGPFVEGFYSMKREISMELRTAYPLWQGISAEDILTSSLVTGDVAGSVFAYKKFGEKAGEVEV